MAQCAQLQPQEDFPRFFCRIKDRRMQATTPARATQITIVAQLATIHCSIARSSFADVLKPG